MEAYEKLEQEFKAWVGGDWYMVACSSGTTALHLALEALQLPLGSKVLCPEYGMIACPRAITLAGHRPMFADCGNDLLIALREDGILPNGIIDAVMAVHIYGRRVDMDLLFKTMGHLPVVEDMAEAHGVPPDPRSDAACWSFYRNKIIAGEEGGMIAFRDPAKADLARSLRSQGFTEAHDFMHIPRGINGRLSNANAELIRESLDNVQENLAKRKVVEGWYNDRIPTEWKMPPRDVPWVYDLRIPGMTFQYQDSLVGALQALGVQARHGFKPMTMQLEYISHLETFMRLNAYRMAQEVIYLPIQPGIPQEVVEKNVCILVREANKLGLLPEQAVR